MRGLIEAMYLDITRGETNNGTFVNERLGATGIVLESNIDHEEFVKLQELVDWDIERSLRQMNWKTVKGRRVFDFGRKG